MKYLHELSRRIEAALAESRNNVAVAQDKMKSHFDKRSTERSLEIGSLVLVLEPTSGNKLMASWF